MGNIGSRIALVLGGASLAGSLLLLAGCGYPIEYSLTKDEIVSSNRTKPMNVVVATFSDERPPEERTKPGRTAIRSEDPGGYTFDDEFRGEVNEGISSMMAEHLAYSKSFAQIRHAPVAAGQITDAYVDSLRRTGVDAILCGEVRHFYGYYYTDALDVLFPTVLGCAVMVPLMVSSIEEETTYFMGGSLTTHRIDAGTELLADAAGTAATMIGVLLMNVRGRDFEWNTELSCRLVSTSTLQTHWEYTARSASKGNRSFTGFGKTKHKLAVESLCDATNKIVENLSLATVDTALAGVHAAREWTPTVSAERKSEGVTPAFAVQLKPDETASILDKQVVVKYEQGKFSRSVLSFENIIGVARDLDGPFEESSLKVADGDVFYFQAKTLYVYRVRVGEDRDGVSLRIQEM
jgi:hypothetical protein